MDATKHLYKSVHLVNYFRFLENGINGGSAYQRPEAGLKLGDQNGCKYDCNTKDVEPVDQSSWQTTRKNILLLKMIWL